MVSPSRGPKDCPTCGRVYPADAIYCATDGAVLRACAAEADPYLGQRIDGDIELRALAGTGAMGRVYRGFQRGTDRHVAVKVLHRELGHNRNLVARFHREAKVASRLSHPNVVHVYFTGQLPDSSMFMVMEYLDGLSLQAALSKAGGALPLPRALHIILQLCDAVGEAHAQGIVHRDIKPENVMLVAQRGDPDFVKVLDFGVARLGMSEASSESATGLIFGTARYISPEGARGETVGPPGDVYGIACVLYQLLCGRTPFEGKDTLALLVQQIQDPPPSLRSIPRGSYVPEPIANAIMRNLEKAAERRSPTARELGRELIEAADQALVRIDDAAMRRRFGAASANSVQLASLHATRSADAGVVAPAPTARSALAADFVPTRADGPAWESPLDPTLDEDDSVSADAVAKRLSETPTPAAAAPEGGGDVPAQKEAPPSSSFTKPRLSRRGAVLVVGVGFLVGGAIALGAATGLGLLPLGRDQKARTAEATVDDFVARANDALARRAFDSPPGANVRDVTTQGLKKFPSEGRLLAIRHVACDLLIVEALESRRKGNVREAERQARLALELHPDDVVARDLHAELTAQLLDAGIRVGPETDGGKSSRSPSALDPQPRPSASVPPLPPSTAPSSSPAPSTTKPPAAPSTGGTPRWL